jgi:hypothetical protein
MAARVSNAGQVVFCVVAIACDVRCRVGYAGESVGSVVGFRVDSEGGPKLGLYTLLRIFGSSKPAFAMPPTRLQLAKTELSISFDQAGKAVFSRQELKVLLSQNRAAWRLAPGAKHNPAKLPSLSHPAH